MNYLCIVYFALTFNAVFSLPHCEVPDFGNTVLKRGVINTVYLTDNLCKTCGNQLELLSSLLDLLEEKGIKINLIISSNDSLDHVPPISKQFQFDDGAVWKAFKGSNGHIIIFDSCGRLTYEVIMPWAMLEYPYVLAAILSTLIDHPCGKCDQILPTKAKKPGSEVFVNGLKFQLFPPILRNEVLQPVVKEAPDGTVPLRIVFDSPHSHVDDNHRYEHIEIVTGDPDYHGHLETEEDVSLEGPLGSQESEEQDLDTNSYGEAFASNKKSPSSSSVEIVTDKREDVSQDHSDQNKITEQNFNHDEIDDYIDTSAVDSSPQYVQDPANTNENNDEAEKEELQSHYNKLVKWVDYPFEDILNFNTIDS